MTLQSIFQNVQGIAPNNSQLVQNRTTAQQKHPETQLQPVVGTTPWSFVPSFVLNHFGCVSAYLDGLVCGESANGSQAN